MADFEPWASRSAPTLHARLHGRGARGVPVVLSHALGLDASMWDAVAGELADAHPVLCVEHRGHGGSAAPAGPYTMEQLADDAARAVDDWGRGGVLFVGLSMGGMVAQGLALRHPDRVRALLLANTAARYPADALPVWRQRIAEVEARGLAAVADAAIERWLTPAFRAAHPQAAAALRATLLRCDAQGYVAACHAVAGVDWLDALGAIACPTFVIAGAHDQGTPPAMARDIAQRIAGATLEVWDDCAHLSAVEHPRRFAQRVRALAARLG